MSVPALLAEGTETTRPGALSPRLLPGVACTADNLEGLSMFLERDQDFLHCQWSISQVLCSSAVELLLLLLSANPPACACMQSLSNK